MVDALLRLVFIYGFTYFMQWWVACFGAWLYGWGLLVETDPRFAREVADLTKIGCMGIVLIPMLFASVWWMSGQAVTMIKMMLDS